MPAAEPVVAGRDGRGRLRLLALTVASLVAAIGVWVAVGTTEAGALAAILLVGSAGVCLTLAVWRRPHSFEATVDGLRFQDGGKVFGERYLVPWREVAGLGTQPARGGKLRLVYQRRGGGRWLRLPTPPMEAGRALATVEAIESVRPPAPNRAAAARG